MRNILTDSPVRSGEPSGNAIDIRGILKARTEAYANGVSITNKRAFALNEHSAYANDMQDSNRKSRDMALPDPDGGEFHETMYQYRQMIMLYESAVEQVVVRLELIEKECAAKECHVPIHSISSRIKSPMSIHTKLKALEAPLTCRSIWDCLHDVAGVRVVCDYRCDIYRIRDILASDKYMKLLEEKDYIKNPKQNGYRSLHLIVNVPVPLTEGLREVKCEIQLRTTAMDSWASLEHHLRYKHALSHSDDIDRDLKQCADALDETDRKMEYIAEQMRIFDGLNRIGDI